MSPTPPDAPTLRDLTVNGIRLRVAEQGRGPLLLFCHGWPESWYAWRAQMAAAAAAGWHAVAPDLRGYGGSEAPAEVERYTLLHLVGDVVGLAQALGADRQGPPAVIVGHDWGAPVAWHAALLRPDLFRAVAGLSVPYTPPIPLDLLGALERRGITSFYMQYFQAEGVAEAEFERDVADSLRRIYFSGSGDAPEGLAFGRMEPGRGFLHHSIDPPTLPAWLSEADLAQHTAEFQRAGFRGGLNWYRNLRRNAQLLAPWYGCPVRQPSLFIAGERDAVLKFPASRAQIDAFAQTLPGLRGCHILPGAGHWIQRERADAVNALLLDFLRGL